MKKYIYLVFIIYAATIQVSFSSSASEPSASQLPQRGVCAHRGAMATHPENTLPAFREAIRLGAHMIEFDVQTTKDGKLVIMHDATVNRTTNGKGKIDNLTLAELKQLDAGVKKGPQFKGTRIPTLTETLLVMSGNVWLNVHLKGGEALALKVAETIVRENRQHQAFLACGAASAKAVRRAYPEIAICNMERQSDSMDYATQTIEGRYQFIQLLSRSGEVSPAVIQKLKDHKIRINYCCVETPAQLCFLLDAGVEFPLVNDVAPMMNAAKKIGIQPLQPIPHKK